MPFSYTVNGKLVELHEDPEKIAIRFDRTVAGLSRRNSIDPRPELGSFDQRLEIPNEPLTIVPVASAIPSIGQLHAAQKALQGDKAVRRTTPVFKIGSRSIVASDRINLGLKQAAAANVQSVLDSVAAELVSGNAGSFEYTIRIPEDSDPLEVVGKLAANPNVAYAEPDFITIGAHRARRVAPGGATTIFQGAHGPIQSHGLSQKGAGDPLAPHQYALTITGADLARSYVTGLQEIRIAVLDEGIDLNHADLHGVIVGDYDAFNGIGQQPKPWDAHGTACAGPAAAIANGVGIRGIAAGSKLLAVRIAHSTAPGGNWITSDSSIRDAIDWAWRNSADILSNSWGGGAPSTAISNAFERARQQGRNGKGCVIAIAAGNDNSPVEFPATLPNLLCVSASNEFDEAKTPTSQDGESWWGSSYGKEVSVAAPGVHNYTTDITGAAGYGQGDYYPDFNGTSSATPIVAGIAALVLAARPHSTESEVREFIISTAAHVGRDPYINGHNDRMGYGRVDAIAAVQKALATP